MDEGNDMKVLITGGPDSLVGDWPINSCALENSGMRRGSRKISLVWSYSMSFPSKDFLIHAFLSLAAILPIRRC